MDGETGYPVSSADAKAEPEDLSPKGMLAKVVDPLEKAPQLSRVGGSLL